MAYKALTTFSGKIAMVKGEVREIADEKIAKDLIRAGYVVDLSERQKAQAQTQTKSAKTSKKSKAGDSDAE